MRAYLPVCLPVGELWHGQGARTLVDVPPEPATRRREKACRLRAQVYARMRVECVNVRMRTRLLFVHARVHACACTLSGVPQRSLPCRARACQQLRPAPPRSIGATARHLVDNCGETMAAESDRRFVRTSTPCMCNTKSSKSPAKVVKKSCKKRWRYYG